MQNLANDKAIARSLKELVGFLNGLSQRAPLDELGRLLGGLDVTPQCLKPFRKFGDLCYRRNLICEGPWYELLCICWRSGQRSPIHNHAGSTCGLRIIQGIATETAFEATPIGQIKAVRSVDCAAGHVCCTQDTDIHQVSNLQAVGNDLVTLHIYSPPLRSMQTFSLLGAETDVYTPRNSAPICHVGDCI